jgi:hypothetical protein
MQEPICKYARAKTEPRIRHSIRVHAVAIRDVGRTYFALAKCSEYPSLAKGAVNDGSS